LTRSTTEMHLIALPEFPLVEPGDDLAALIQASLARGSLFLEDGDLLVIAQKVVSKAEDRYVYLNRVEVGDRAEQLALEVDKDPRLVQVILDQSNVVVAHRQGVLIVEHQLGYVHANAGIDQSNITSDEKNPRILLLPENPDASADELVRKLKTSPDQQLSVIINDSAGRAWRNGSAGFAIGTSGFVALEDMIGNRDLFGREMQVTEVAIADELAAAASFLMGQAGESAPVVLVKGANLTPSSEGSGALIRARDRDLFR
jgi:coenzyme F420-0:L-glutamate ligase/coenzyme F420-1:gamma-L-glutamate ligase